MENLLVKSAKDAVLKLYGIEVDEKQLQVQKTRKEFKGDLTLVTFPLLKISKKTPELTGEDLGEFLQNNVSEIIAFNVVKGFLNLTISDKYWQNQLKHILSLKDFGKFASSGKTIMVEYSSPNTNKPLHLGHIRNNLLGYSVAEILKANGHNVIKTQVINDRGIHICKSMLAYEKWGNDEQPTPDFKGDKLVGKYYVEFENKLRAEASSFFEKFVRNDFNQLNIPSALQQKIIDLNDKINNEGDPERKLEAEIMAVARAGTKIMREAQEMLQKWEAKDPKIMALWEKMNNWCYAGFEVTYNRLGVDFDKEYYESTTYLEGKKQVEIGLAKGLFFQKDDGSVWIDLTNEGLDEKILQRSDGTAVYMTQDIGTAILRYTDYPDLSQIIYTVGNEQDYHFNVLFKVLNKLGYDWAKNCFHLSYGMVDLPSGKMKSREGTVVDADDLMEEMVDTAKTISENLGKLEGVSVEDKAQLYELIGLGALKYFMLKVDPKKRMLFNPEESVDFNGNTGPFIQYAHARISSVLRKYDQEVTIDFHSVGQLDESEKELIKLLNDYPVVIKEAGQHYSPAIIANYSYELVKAYNHFYQAVPILKAEGNELELRVGISKATKNVICSAMKLLGITVPERM